MIKNCDTARPMDNASSTPPSPPSGPMTRSRAKAIHDKVNSFLYMCDFDPTMNCMLPHANALCVLRHEPQHSPHGRIEEGREDGQVSKKKQPETARDSAVRAPDSPPPPETPPHTSRTLRPPSIDLDAPACDNSRVPDRRLPGDSPDTPPQPETPAHTDRRLRPEAGLRA